MFGAVFLLMQNGFLLSLSHPVGGLLNFAVCLSNCLLNNRNMVRHGSQGLISVDPICHKDINYQLFHSLSSWFSQQIICTLLLVHCSDGCMMMISSWWMLCHLHKFWNFAERKFVPTSETTLQGSPCCMISLGFFHWIPLLVYSWGISLWYSTIQS